MKNEINEAHQDENSEKGENSKERNVVVPGEVIVTGDDFLPGEGARRDGNNVVATRFGLSEVSGRVVKVISISGTFIPRRGNNVIGRVVDITFKGWVIDIDYASNAFLSLDEVPRFINKNEMDQFLSIGDVVSAKIYNIGARGTDLSLKGRGLGKLEGGFTFRVVPSRVPRIIGREGSMISLIKDKTECNINVGQNGWVWIKGPTVDAQIKARQAIEFVASKVYVSGLTEKMEEWFKENGN